MVFSANGKLAPPMIVYPYKRITSEIVANTPNGWTIGLSESGWMVSEVFYEYVANDFKNWLEIEGVKKPVLLFIDGHKSHLTMQLSEFCDANGIIF